MFLNREGLPWRQVGEQFDVGREAGRIESLRQKTPCPLASRVGLQAYPKTIGRGGEQLAVPPELAGNLPCSQVLRVNLAPHSQSAERCEAVLRPRVEYQWLPIPITVAVYRFRKPPLFERAVEIVERASIPADGP